MKGAKKQTKSKMTLDGLAVMVDKLAVSTAKGFDASENRDKEIWQFMSKEFSRIGDDVRDVKSTLGPLARIAGEQDRKISELEVRIRRLERKI